MGHPRRRAFDLIENLEVLRRQPVEQADTPLSSVEQRTAETLIAIAQAMVPTVDEIREIARRHGITGTVPALLRNPAVTTLVAARFPYQQPGRAACEAYYEAHAEEFRSPDLYEGGEILIGGDVTDRDWRAEAYGRAERIIAMLHFDRRVFNDLLVYSVETAQDRGGRIGPVPRGGWDSELATPFFSLKPGEVFPLPVPSRRGFHVLMMERVELGRLRPFAEVESTVVARLAARSRLAAAQQYLQGLSASTATR